MAQYKYLIDDCSSLIAGLAPRLLREYEFQFSLTRL